MNPVPLFGALASSLALWAAPAGGAPNTAATAAGPEWVSPAPVPGPGVQHVPLETMLAAARADAVRRTGTALAAQEVLSAAPVTWPDGSLGCPQPGMLYTMALVSGYRIVISVQGQTLHYHASQRGGLLLCPAARSRMPTPDGRI